MDTSLTLSMTRILSLREFAKRKRANSWQSKGKFVFKFMDCQQGIYLARNDSGICHFEPLQKAKNPKKIETYFNFMDTSLRPVWQGRLIWQNPCHFELSLESEKSTEFRHNANLWIATNLHAYALQILAMTNSLSYFYKLSYWLIFCHTDLFSPLSYWLWIKENILNFVILIVAKYDKFRGLLEICLNFRWYNAIFCGFCSALSYLLIYFCCTKATFRHALAHFTITI